jgi:hypothetical protein
MKLGKPTGSPKSGGRKAGTPNKRSVWLREELDRANIDWGLELKKALDTLDYKKAEILVSLLPFLNPKLKEKEVEDTQETSSEDSEDSILNLIKK